MALRAKIIEQEEARKRRREMEKSDPVRRESFNKDGEREMSWADRIEGLEVAANDFGELSLDDSERLKRIERMLVEIYKKLGL